VNLTRPIVVVDGRTCRAALRKIKALIDLGDYTPAKFGVTAARIWLKYELGCGPLWARFPVLGQVERRRRVLYASYLKELGPIEEQLNELMGLTRRLNIE
jgi:hypothetical protein